jgi:hypothetical protein
MLIYLDNCCFNRPFDNQTTIKIRLETEAKLYIQDQIKAGKIKFAWSYILDYENSANPFPEKKDIIAGWEKSASKTVYPNENVSGIAKDLYQQNIKAKDAIHIACAVDAGCDFFLTTDHELIKKLINFKQIKVINPVRLLEYFEE